MPGDPDKIEDVALWKTLDLWPDTPISLDFNRRLFTFIDSAERSGKRRRRAASSTATLVIACAISFLLFRSNPQEVTPAPNAASIASVDAQAVVQTLSDFDMLKQIDSTRFL